MDYEITTQEIGNPKHTQVYELAADSFQHAAALATVRASAAREEVVNVRRADVDMSRIYAAKIFDDAMQNVTREVIGQEKA